MVLTFSSIKHQLGVWTIDNIMTAVVRDDPRKKFLKNSKKEFLYIVHILLV